MIGGEELGSSSKLVRILSYVVLNGLTWLLGLISLGLLPSSLKPSSASSLGFAMALAILTVIQETGCKCYCILSLRFFRLLSLWKILLEIK
jgi:hypothetical protein